MTRNDYYLLTKAIAQNIDAFEDGGACQFGAECVADSIARVLEDDNPRFDNERFRAACHLTMSETA